MQLSEKQASVEELKGLFQNAGASFVLSYQGCDCAQLTALRKEIGTADAKFAVVKNTLARRALEQGGIGGLDQYFKGPVAVVWAGEDPVSPAKVIKKHAKEIEHLQVKAGYLDGAVVAPDGVDQLASLPSKEELLAKLLYLINAPATRLAQTINAPASKLAQTLEAWRVELEGRGA